MVKHCFMDITQFVYKTPREWMHLSTLWKTKSNHCLLFFCWTIVFSYMLITATYVNNSEEAFERTNAHKLRLSEGCVFLMVINWLGLGPWQSAQILQSDQTIMDFLVVNKHTVTFSMESWTLFHSFQAWSQTKSVTWRLLQRVTNSVSLSLCLVCEDSRVWVIASHYCSIKSAGCEWQQFADKEDNFNVNITQLE